MKILVLGDIHGKLIWNDIVKLENPDLTIFLGDYVTTHGSETAEQQLSNLEDILNFKYHYPDMVVLLRGNHDLQSLDYSWAQCSGYNRKVAKGMIYMKERFLDLTQWLYVYNNIIFSHAGISKEWLKQILRIEKFDGDKINNTAPSELFGFNGDRWDMYGTSPEQSCTWIRPETLVRYAIDGYTQIVGHTPVKNIINCSQQEGSPNKDVDIWLCDCLDFKQYLIIDNDKFIPKTLKE